MGRSGVDSSNDRSQRWAAEGWNPGFYHRWVIPWFCEQLSTSRLKVLSKTTEASFMIDGLRTGIWKWSLRNISQESCLHVVMSHNINLYPQANLRSHTKVRPVLVTHKTVFVAWTVLQHFNLFHGHFISTVLQPIQAYHVRKLLSVAGNFPFSGFRGNSRGKLLFKIKCFICL
jgi:hypothetical protein